MHAFGGGGVLGHILRHVQCRHPTNTNDCCVSCWGLERVLRPTLFRFCSFVLCCRMGIFEPVRVARYASAVGTCMKFCSFLRNADKANPKSSGTPSKM